MSLLDELRAKFGVAVPGPEVPLSTFEGTNPIEKSLRIAQGERFAPEPFLGGESTGIDQFLQGVGGGEGFGAAAARGFTKVPSNFNVEVAGGGPQAALHEASITQADPTPTLGEGLVEGLVEFSPLILGSLGATLPAAVTTLGLAESAGALTSLSVANAGLLGAPGFFLAENIATGIVADAALDRNIAEGIVYSAMGTGMFVGLGKALKAGIRLPKFALEQASEFQKNAALRSMAQGGTDPRAVDLANQFTEAGRTIDQVTGGATQMEQQANAVIWKTQNPRSDLRTLVASLNQFTEEVVDQRNITEILSTRTGQAVEEKTTVNLGLARMLETEEIVKRLGADLGQTFDILDRVSPTVTASERLAILNGNVEVFSEVSRRWGTPDENIRRVIEASQGPDMPIKLFESLEEQALIHRRKGRIDVVNPAFNGADPVARQFMELPVEARKDIVNVLRAFGMDTADSSLAKSIVEFDARIQRFFEKGGGEGKVDPFVDTSRVVDEPFVPQFPPLGKNLESDVLRGVARTAPSDAAAERALTPGETVGQFKTQAQSILGLDTAAGRTSKVLANGVPLPIDPLEAAAVRQTLFDIADVWIQSKPGLALQAVHTLKNFDIAQKSFADTFTDMGVQLSKFDGPFGNFVRRRFSLQGEFLGTRLQMSSAMDATSTHFGELIPRVSRDIFGRDKTSQAIAVVAPSLNKFTKALDLSPEKALRSFVSIQRHEFGHEVHRALKTTGSVDDKAVAEAIELAAHRQPYRNDDFSFREMTGAPMGKGNRWVKPHSAKPLNESVAELVSNLMTPQGRAHVHPNARDILEGVGIVIQEPYKPFRKAFQFGPGDVDAGINRATGEANAPVLGRSADILEEAPPTFASIGKTLAKAFPVKGPSAKTAGNAIVGPTKLGVQRSEVQNNAIAAISNVRRIAGGPEKQLGLFSQTVDEGFSISRPSKQVQDKLERQLGGLGSQALQTFNESLITLPRSAQAKFVKRFLEDGDKVLKVSFLEYTKALREWRASAMLFGPPTWMVNIVSTMLNTAIRPATSLVAGGLDAARVAAFGGERVRFASDAVADLAGLMNGARDAINFLKADINKLRGRQPVPQNTVQELFETGSVLRKGGFRESIFQGSDSAFLFTKKQQTSFAKRLGAGIQVPFQILRISDNAMFTMNFTGEMYRLASNELRRQGKTFNLGEIAKLVEGQALQSSTLRKKAAAFAELELEKNFGEGFRAADGSIPVPLKALQDDMVQKSLLDSIPQSMAEAKQIAERTIFVARETGQLDKMLAKIDESETLRLAFDVAVPFRRTPMNIVREGIRTSPLGFLTAGETIGQLVGTVPKTAEELVDAYAQAAVGTMLYAGLTGLALYGVLEGNPEHFEQNRALRTTMLADGRLPETVFINIGGGKKLSLPLSRLQPIGGLILGALRASETIKNEGLKTIRPDVLFGTQVDFIFALGLQDQIEGTADFIESLVSDDPRFNFAERFGGSFVPSFIRQSRQALGIEQGRSAKPTEANALTRFFQGAQAGAFNRGLPKLGLFGEPLKRTPVLGAAGVATVGRDPVVTALIDAGSFHQAPDIFPQLRDGSAQQKNAFVRGKGQLQKQFVTRAIQAIPNWENLPQERRKRIIDAAFTRASNVANRRGRNALRAGAVITPGLIITGKIGI